MSISSSPAAATVETRASHTVPPVAHAAETAHPLSAFLTRRLDRRRAARTLAASGIALGLGSTAIITTAAQDAPADGSTDTTTAPGTADATTSGGSGGGQAIADFALQYVGLPYAAAGRDPGTGFDCSGFTWYVVMNVLGIDIGGSPEGQVGFGSPVDYGAWQPGDLVFFANTFREGISHVGIAIGGSQMVHAENESTGVTVSDITSDYYASHYASASRL